MNIEKSLQQSILPGKVLAVQVGISRTAVLVETAEGIRCGLAATLTNPEIENHHQHFVQRAGHLHEMDSAELAALVESPSYTEASVGLAAINALLPRQPERWEDLNAEEYLLQKGAGRNVALVGHFPFIERLKAVVKNLWVLELNPRPGDLPAGSAPEVLPKADFVAMTGTTLINKTFAGLLALCPPATRVVMLGPSTPLSPLLFEAGVAILSGTIVEDPRATLLGVGQGISLRQLRQAGSVRLVSMRPEPGIER